MKRTFWIWTVIFFILTSSAMADVVIKGSFDTEGNWKASYASVTDEKDVEGSYSIALDVLGSITRFLQLGIGAEYQFPRSRVNAEGDFYFIPIYGVARLPINLMIVRPYATARIGYNFYLGDDTYKGPADLRGGLHYSVGAGVILFDFLLVEADYSIYNGIADFSSFESKDRYSKISIYAGVNFGKSHRRKQ